MMVAAPQLQFGSRGGYSRLTTQEGVTVYNSDFIFSFACAATYARADGDAYSLCALGRFTWDGPERQSDR